MAVITFPDQLPTVSGTSWQGVRYGCTTRMGGVSQMPFASLNLATHVNDDPAAVRRNRQILAHALGSMPIWLEQVHGTDVFDADTSPQLDARADPHCDTNACLRPEGPDPLEVMAVADAAITSRPGVVLAILTADCLPVVIADTQGRAVGIAHAGWRGLAAGVLENTILALRRRLPADAVLRAWIGPAISQAVFEVGADVHQAFCEARPENEMYFVARVRSDKTSAPKWLADLPGLARQRMRDAGLRYIECSGWCTLRQPELFFSYRGSTRTGRMATLAWLDQAPELP